MHKGCKDNLLRSFINRGVRRGGAERGRGEGLKGGIRVSIVAGVRSSYLDAVGLFH